MCSSSGSGKSDSKENSSYGVSWHSNLADITLISLRGSLHFLISLGLVVTWGVALGSVCIIVAWTPSKAAIEVPSELVGEEGSV